MKKKRNKTVITDALKRRMVAEYRKGSTLTILSVNNEIGVATVRKILTDAGVEIRGKGASFTAGGEKATEARAKKMAQLYKKGQTLQEIGDTYDLSRERVRQILRAADVESLGRREKKSANEPLNAAEKKIAAAYDGGMKPADIITKFKITYVEMREILKRGNIETKPKGFFNRRPGYDKIRKGIIKDYLADVDTGVIAEKYGLCGRTEIYKFIGREGVSSRLSHSMKKTKIKKKTSTKKTA